MKRYLPTLEEEKTPKRIEEYLGAFTESMKVVLQQNPVDRIGHAVLLASKTSLRLKAANPKLKEYEIANQLQKIARSLRLATILKDLTPEEKGILKLMPEVKLNGLLKSTKSFDKAKVKKSSKKTSTASKAKKVSRKKRG